MVDEKADLGLHSPHVPEDAVSLGVVQLIQTCFLGSIGLYSKKLHLQNFIILS